MTAPKPESLPWPTVYNDKGWIDGPIDAPSNHPLNQSKGMVVILTEYEARELWEMKKRSLKWKDHHLYGLPKEAAVDEAMRLQKENAHYRERLARFEEAAEILLDWEQRVIADTLYKVTDDLRSGFSKLRTLLEEKP